ncbi:hypothetical protein [Pseudoteredinibacter isoporae]
MTVNPDGLKRVSAVIKSTLLNDSEDSVLALPAQEEKTRLD